MLSSQTTSSGITDLLQMTLSPAQAMNSTRQEHLKNCTKSTPSMICPYFLMIGRECPFGGKTNNLVLACFLLVSSAGTQIR